MQMFRKKCKGFAARCSNFSESTWLAINQNQITSSNVQQIRSNKFSPVRKQHLSFSSKQYNVIIRSTSLLS